MQQKQWLTLKASAGSGKTFALTLRYLALLFLGAKANEILALTFTKKAAGEMQDRILKALQEIIDHPKESLFLKALQKEYGFDDAFVLKQIPIIHQDFIHTSPKIMTIDSFFNFVVKKFCWHVGLSKNYEIKEQNQEAIEEIFLKLLQPSLYRNLLEFDSRQNISSFSLLQQIHQNSIHLQLYAIENPKDYLFELSEEILILATQIKQKIIQHPQASSRAKDAIKNQDINMLLEKITWLCDGDHYLYFKKLHLHEEKHFEILRQKVKIYFDLKEQILLNILQTFLPFYERARNIYHQKSHSLDFGDLTHKAFEILHHQIHRDFFYFRLDSKISHILIDEFQDTNKIQYDILYPLIEEIKSGDGRIAQRSLFFVGDSKQSIYGFRGSDSGIFDYVKPYTKEENLPLNYRSAPLIVAFNNAIFKEVFTNYIPQKTPNIAQQEGYVKVYEPLLDNEAMEMHVLKSIQMLLAQNIKPQDIAILCYKNDDLDRLKNFLNAHADEICHSSIITENNLKLTQRNQPQILIQCLLYTQNPNPLHLKNIAKLLGESYESINTIPPFTQNHLASFIFTLMQHFCICDVFAQKFLEIAFLYDDIAIFLEEIEKIQIDPIKEKLQGITLMTIHKSKGLEFDHLILCDRFSKKRGDGKRFFLDQNRIWYKQKNRELVDCDFQKALQNHQQKLIEESHNVLYVACTRAKKSLFILPKQKDSAFQSLHLTPQETGHIMPSNQEVSPVPSHPIIPIQQISYGRQEGFLNQTSHHPNSYQDLIFGEAMHLGAEYLLGYQIKKEHLQSKLLNTYGFLLPQKALTTIIKRLDTLQNQEEFKSFFAQKNISAETSFIQDQSLYRIDLMLLGEEEIVLLDYKTSAQKQEHQEQLRHYLQFTKNIYHNKEIKAYLIYLWDQPKLQKLETS